MNFVEENDQFDRLPDALLRHIFNNLRDAQSLTRCSIVCKRFASIIPEVDDLILTVPRKSLIRGGKQLKSKYADCNRGSKNVFKSLIRKVITKPLQFLLRIITLKSSSSEDETDCSYYSPTQVLKNFKEIQSLHIELPGYGGDIGSNDGDSLLKWRAEFGSELESCVVLGAKSYHRISSHNDEQQQQSDNQDLSLADNELKLRVVWTISCLIAASSRHYLVQQVVSEHQMLRSAVVTDASKQGRLCMRREQIEELKSSNIVTSKSGEVLESSSERTPVPALKVKLWYLPLLELPESGCVLKGATLMVIRPLDGAKKTTKIESDGDLVARVCNWEEGEEEEEEEEEKVFGEAVKEMLKKKKKYTLEMNSF